MPKVEEIKVLNVDDTVLAVDAQSEEVKALVSTYNEWNQDLANKQKEHAQIRAAVQTLSQQIIHVIRQEKEAAVKAVDSTSEPSETPVEVVPVKAVDSTSEPSETPVEVVPEQKEAVKYKPGV